MKEFTTRKPPKTYWLKYQVSQVQYQVSVILDSIENKGVELAVSWRDQIGDWGYNVGANLTTIKNKVLSLVQEGYSIIAGDKSQSYTMAGYPIGYFYGYKVEGVYQTQEEINNSPKNTLATVHQAT